MIKNGEIDISVGPFFRFESETNLLEFYFNFANRDYMELKQFKVLSRKLNQYLDSLGERHGFPFYIEKESNGQNSVRYELSVPKVDDFDKKHVLADFKIVNLGTGFFNYNNFFSNFVYTFEDLSDVVSEIHDVHKKFYGVDLYGDFAFMNSSAKVYSVLEKQIVDNHRKIEIQCDLEEYKSWLKGLEFVAMLPSEIDRIAKLGGAVSNSELFFNPRI